ncbi:tail sheath protein [Hylemonella gracilis str. Niagara R]|uniref:Tail sheath protein n=1 Tax=Hylemonella gracilis str. Niagara R TaxID=1458275 RepID=A0A016XIQ7_9BURK|nr:phage tail sheath subtilisin-like domain-containing protein [Hylemonella gracilis]EYC51447.1 tail sheath protein [Hylemonella gracilis str. Niagara R]
MSLTSYHHGIRVLEETGGARAIATASASVIGMAAVADDADATTFPLNTPVLLTRVADAIGKAGEAGTLAASLEAISNQASPLCVVVRVAEGEGEDAEAIAAATAANVIGTVTPEGQRTGLQALLTAQAALGVRPRILGAPGLDSSQAVATALATLGGKLRGMAYAGTGGSQTLAAAVAYRENFAARELMLIHPDFQRFDTASAATVDAPATAYALGLRAAINTQTGWHKTISNVAVNGVTGISKPIHWDLQSSATDAGLLNEAGITTLIRSNGYKFWGSRTCSDDPNFIFESAVWARHIVADTIAEGLEWAADKTLHPSIVKDILETINAKGREFVTAGHLLGFSAWYDEQVNSTDRLKAGKLAIDFDYTPVPPLEDLALRQRITDRYFSDFAARVAN